MESQVRLRTRQRLANQEETDLGWGTAQIVGESIRLRCKACGATSTVPATQAPFAKIWHKRDCSIVTELASSAPG